MPAFKFGPKALLALKFEDFKIFSTMLENLPLQNQNKSQDGRLFGFLAKQKSKIALDSNQKSIKANVEREPLPRDPCRKC